MYTPHFLSGLNPFINVGGFELREQESAVVYPMSPPARNASVAVFLQLERIQTGHRELQKSLYYKLKRIRRTRTEDHAAWYAAWCPLEPIEDVTSVLSIDGISKSVDFVVDLYAE
jgi:hypothetical protein